MAKHCSDLCLLLMMMMMMMRLMMGKKSKELLKLPQRITRVHAGGRERKGVTDREERKEEEKTESNGREGEGKAEAEEYRLEKGKMEKE